MVHFLFLKLSSNAVALHKVNKIEKSYDSNLDKCTLSDFAAIFVKNFSTGKTRIKFMVGGIVLGSVGLRLCHHFNALSVAINASSRFTVTP